MTLGEKLREASRVLKASGHAVFVNHTRRGELGATFRELRAREGLGVAFRSLLWVVPNAIFEAARIRIGSRSSLLRRRRENKKRYCSSVRSVTSSTPMKWYSAPWKLRSAPES